MWPRVIEGMLGCWMLVTPFVFRGTASIDDYAANALVTGGLLIVASLLSFWQPTRHARFATLLVALWLAAHGYFAAARPGPPAAQNEIMIGLTLLLFAIIPSEATQPPPPWRQSRSRSTGG